jgi:peptidoglycan hydrolase-like protein with peptidoglycan-binding domain
VKSTAHRKSTRHSISAKSTAAKSTAPKPAAVTASNKAATATTTAAHRSSKTGASKTGKKPTAVVARRSNQQQPTQDRYREIQQSLSEKGYFAGQPDGNWGQESVDALKRFQHDQSLTEDGKIGALSLIALGLGPRRTLPAEVAVDTAPTEKPAAEKQIDKPTH